MRCNELIKRKDGLANYNFLEASVGENAAIESLKSYDFSKDVVPFDHTFKGEKSKLFDELTNQYGLKKAIQVSFLIRTTDFLEKYGDWTVDKNDFVGKLNEQKEPTLDAVNKIFRNESASKEMEEPTKHDVLRKKLESDSNYKLGEASVEEVSDMLESGVALATNLVIRDNVKKSTIFNALLNTFSIQRNKASKFIDYQESLAEHNKLPKSELDKIKRGKELLDTILDNEEYKTNYLTLIDSELDSMGFNTINKEATTDINDKNAENPILKEMWDEQSKFEVPIKNTLQFNIRMLLGSIPIPELDNGNLTGNYKTNSIGLAHTYTSNNITLKLLDYFNHRVVDRNSFMSDLKSSGIPEFVELASKVDKLSYNKDRLLNALTATVGRLKNNKVVAISEGNNFIVYNTNNRSDRKYITDTWYGNQNILFKESDIVELNKNNELVYSETGKKRLQHEYNNIHQILNSSNTRHIAASHFVGKLSSLVHSDKFGEAKSEEKTKMLNDMISMKEGKTIKSNSLLMPVEDVYSLLPTILKKGKDGRISFKTSDYDELSKKLLDLDIKEDTENVDDAININKINVVSPLIRHYLALTGMDFELDTIKKFLQNPGRYMTDLTDGVTEPTVKLSDLTTPRKVANGVNVLHLLIQDINKGGSGQKDENANSLRNNNPLNTNASKKVFTKLKEIEEVADLSSTFINSFGKQESSYGFNTFLSKEINNLKGNTLDGMNTDPLSRRSLWYKAFKGDDSVAGLIERPERLSLLFGDGVKEAKTGKIINRASASPLDKEVMRINLFAYNNAGFTDRLSVIDALVFSDKSRTRKILAPRISLKGEDYNFNLDFKNKESLKDYSISDVQYGDDVKHVLTDMALTEIDRINDTVLRHKEAKDVMTSERSIGGSKFLIFPSLDNKVINSFKRSDGSFDTSNKEFISKVQKHMNLLLTANANENLKEWKDVDLIRASGGIKYLDSRHKKHVGEKISVKDSNDRNIFNYDKRTKDSYVTADTALELALNEMVTNLNMIQLVGDVADYYKAGNTPEETSDNTFSNYYKRLGSVGGAKMNIAQEFRAKFGKVTKNVKHNRINYVYAKDIKTNKYAKEYLNALNVSGWENVNMSDAAEYTTLRDHIVTLHGEGRLNDNVFNKIHSKIIESYRNDTLVKLTEDEAIAIIPQKPLYAGTNNVDGLRVATIVKSSAFPLLESITGGTPFDAVRKAMEAKEKEEIFDRDNKLAFDDSNEILELSTTRLAFESGVKVGNAKLNDIFNEDFTIKDGALKDIKYTNVDREHLGIQQEESENDSRKINIVSQMNKLVTSEILDTKGFKLPDKEKEMSGIELRDLKEKLKKAIMDKKAIKLFKDVGYDEATNSFTDEKKFMKYLESKLSANEISAEDVKMLIDKDGNQVAPLYLNKSYGKIMSSLLASISKDVIKPKISGKGAVQLSSVGLLFNGDMNNSNIIFTRRTDADGNIIKLDRLEHTKYKNGELKRAQLLVSREFFEKFGIDLDNATEIIDGRKVMKEGVIDDRLLKAISARIPNQKHSSMLQAEIVGFLPKDVKETVIVSDGITKQMGSDFDIDHLYNYLYNYKVQKITHKEDLTKDLTKFNKLVERAKEGYAPRKSNLHKVLKSMDREDYNEELIKIGIAKHLDKFYDTKSKQLYDIVRDFKLSKITMVDANRDKINKITDLSTEALENRYIDIHHSILEHKEVLPKMLEVLDLPDAKLITKDIDSSVPKIENTMFSPLSGVYNKRQYESNQGGKDGISIQSSLSMLHIALEKDNFELQFKKFSETKRENENVFKFIVDGKEVVFKAIGRGSYNFKGNKRTNLTTNTILQNEAVDNAKNKLLFRLGYSAVTSPAYNLLNFLAKDGKSMPLSMIAKMFRQKGVLEAYRYAENKTSMFNDSSKSFSEYMKEYALNKYDGDKNFSISEEILDKGLKGKNTSDSSLNNSDYESLQSTLIDKLSKAQEFGSNLLRIYSSANLETKGIGSSTGELLLKEYNINKFVVNNSRFRGTYRLLGDAINMDNGVRNVGGNLTELGRIYDYGIRKALNFYELRDIKNNPRTMLGSSRYKNTIRQFIRSGANSEKAIKRVDGAYATYANLNIDNPFFKSSGEAVTINSVRKVLLTGDNDVYTRLIKHLKEPSNLEGRTFLNNINVLPKKNVADPVILKLVSGDLSDIKIDEYIRSFNELLTSNNSKSRNLGKDILRVMLSQGNAYSPNGINKLLPRAYLMEHPDFVNAIKNSSLKDINSTILHEQIVQHNPTLSEKDSNYKRTKQLAETDGSYVQINIEADKADTLPEYLSGKDPERGYVPLKKVGVVESLSNEETIEVIYKAISKLGSGNSNMTEYDPYSVETTSLFKNNNPLMSFEEYAENNNLEHLKDLANNSLRLQDDYGSYTVERNDKDLIFDEYNIKGDTPEDLSSVLNNVSGTNKVIADVTSELLDKSAKFKFKVTDEAKDGESSPSARGVVTEDGLSIRLHNFDTANSDNPEAFRKEFEEVVSHESSHQVLFNEAVAYDKGLSKNKGNRLEKQFALLDTYLGKLKKAIIDGDNTERGEEFKTFEDKYNNKIEGDISVSERDRNQGLMSVHELIADIANDGFLDSLNGYEVDGLDVANTLSTKMKRLYVALIESKGLQNNKGAQELIANVLKFYDDVAKAKKVDTSVEKKGEEALPDALLKQKEHEVVKPEEAKDIKFDDILVKKEKGVKPKQLEKDEKGFYNVNISRGIKIPKDTSTIDYLREKGTFSKIAEYGTKNSNEALYEIDRLNKIGAEDNKRFALDSYIKPDGSRIYKPIEVSSRKDRMYNFRDKETTSGVLKDIASNKEFSKDVRNAANDLLKFENTDKIGTFIRSDKYFMAENVLKDESFDFLEEANGTASGNLVRVRDGATVSEYLHEVYHTYLTDLIANNPKFRNKLKDYQKRVLENFKDNRIIDDIYKDLDEFAVMAVTKPELISLLKSMHSVDKEGSVLYDELVDKYKEAGKDTGIYEEIKTLLNDNINMNKGELSISQEAANWSDYYNRGGTVDGLSVEQKYLIGIGKEPTEVNSHLKEIQERVPNFTMADLTELARSIYC